MRGIALAILFGVWVFDHRNDKFKDLAEASKVIGCTVFYACLVCIVAGW